MKFCIKFTAAGYELHMYKSLSIYTYNGCLYCINKDNYQKSGVDEKNGTEKESNGNGNRHSNSSPE